MSTTPEPTSSHDSRPTPVPAPDPSSFIRARTTLPRRPLPPNSARQPILTERLVLRALRIDDLPAVRELRTQSEVMYWTIAGVPDGDLAETRAKLELLLSPGDEATYNLAICLRETGDLIGMGGCHAWRGQFGWPKVGYMLRKEFWGRGFATEFLRGWVGAWDGLEREIVEVDVDVRTVVGGEEGGLVREQVFAITAAANNRSQGVLRKAGFEWVLTWAAEDLRKGTGPDSMVELPTYRHFPGLRKGE